MHGEEEKGLTTPNYVMFINVKTTGFPMKKKIPKLSESGAASTTDDFYPPEETKYYDNSRVVGVSWIIMDHELKSEVNRSSVLIRPSGKFDINKSATACHGIDLRTLSQPGAIDFREFAQGFLNVLSVVGEIITHCVSFDMNVLLSECCRNAEVQLYEALQSKRFNCTMLMYQNKTSDYGKVIKLSALCAELGIDDTTTDTITGSTRNKTKEELCQECTIKLRN